MRGFIVLLIAAALVAIGIAETGPTLSDPFGEVSIWR